MAASILVLADHPIILENLQLTLEAAGYEVITARDGLAALDLLEARRVDLVLSDGVMAGSDGRTLYERVRRDPRWAALPFLFITGHEPHVGTAGSWRLEARLSKPIQPEELLAAVQGRLVLSAGKLGGEGARRSAV